MSEDADELDLDWVRAVTCECGFCWDPGYHRSTPTEPAWEEWPACPRCGSYVRVTVCYSGEPPRKH